MLLSALVLGLAIPSASPGPASACGEDAPIAAIALSDSGPRAVLVAVWDDGRIIRALAEKDPGRGYAQARLSPSVMEEVRATLLRIRFWTWEAPKADPGARLQLTMACADSHRSVFEHKGVPPIRSGPGQLRDYLMRLRLPSPVRGTPPYPEEWLPWFDKAP